MKTRIASSALWLLALLFVAQNANAQAFEGRVVQSITVPQLGNEPMEMVMNIKEEKMMIAMDMGPTGAMKILTKNGGKSIIMIMEQMGMAMEMDMPAQTTEQKASAPDTKMRATGKKETVNGYRAEEWIAEIGEGATMTMWLSGDLDKSLAKAMEVAMKAQNASSPNAAQSEISRVMAEKGLVAVRTTVSANGETAATIDLVKIEKAKLPDSTFEVPAGIEVQKMDPSMMMQGQD
jgi:hypothetical protein